jgi:hypothetical protein
MPVAKLTKRMVDAISADDCPLIIYDADLKGFGLRAAKAGKKSWFVEYRPEPVAAVSQSGGWCLAPSVRLPLTRLARQQKESSPQ